ncbi:MAG: TRAP transporter large permease subunit, partial [Clostridiales bacterium]|nr:TRAP transporter large permease subunit [Clostridiales bacterium]
MNMGVYLFLLLFALMFSGMPIALGVGMAAILTTGIWGQIGLELIFQQYYQGVNSFALLAVPLFMLAGELMTRLGLVDDIILLAKLLVGRMRGSLAQINIVASVFFATMSGSAVADTAAIGGMLLPAMEKEGYDKEFSVAVTAASSIIGPIIPPSITMIVYGSLMSNVPTGAMFAAGIVPGVLIGLGEMALVYYFSRKRNYPRETKRYTAKEASAIAVRTLPAVLTPVIIVVAIFSGFCSATEAACIANIWVLITGALYYRRLNLKVFGESVIVAMETA